ncbi:MAG TPA: ribonuclease HII [Candidatus Paceibacterota bacterium]|nr:ribonuclease HII [Candidatus Paceibacterota bacterium]
MVKLPSKSLERNLIAAGHACIIGVDEVGMGCLAGPVVVCAVLLRPKFFQHRRRRLEYLRDSKTLQAHQRERYANELTAERYARHAIAVIHPKEVDRLNVYGAARVGMCRAIRRLGLKKADRPFILIDGPGRIKDVPWEQLPVVKGDRKVFAIAAASVLAKVHRDSMMVNYAKRYPGYGLEAHKGYATRLHQRRLVELGPTPLHRRSFRLTYDQKST